MQTCGESSLVRRACMVPEGKCKNLLRAGSIDAHGLGFRARAGARKESGWRPSRGRPVLPTPIAVRQYSSTQSPSLVEIQLFLLFGLGWFVRCSTSILQAHEGELPCRKGVDACLQAVLNLCAHHLLAHGFEPLQN